jgi:hypothetical protein
VFYPNPNKHAVLVGCSTFWPVNCIFLHKKNEDMLHRWVALLLLIFIHPHWSQKYGCLSGVE